MTLHPKTKMCWSCEGSVPLNADECPFCGVSLPTHDSSHSKSSSAIFIPPYQPSQKIDQYDKEEAAQIDSKNLLITNSESYWHFFTTTVCLTGGILFTLFGAMLLIFSDQDGSLTLKWSRSLWILFLCLGLPLLLLGLGFFNRLSKD